MNYYTIQPSPDIASYVRSFWVLECDVTQSAPYIHRTMADGFAELIFHYKGRFHELSSDGESISSFQCGIHAQNNTMRRFLVNDNFGIFGVYLYPFTLQQLFGIPSTDLVNQMPDLKSVLGNKLNGIEDEIMLAANNLQRVDIVTNFLKSRLAKVKSVRPGITEMINLIIHRKGNVNIDELASRNFLSVRQFERNFKVMTGFSPKLFSRIIRFQSATNEFNQANKSLGEIACTCGYYDQSHFIHDFKQFSGYHPKFYFSGTSEATQYL